MKWWCAVALLSGCYVSANITSIKKELDPLSFSGAPVAGQRTQQSKDVTVDLGKGLTKVLSALELEHLILAPLSGAQNMDFLDKLTVVARGDGTLKDVEVAHYLRTGPADSVTGTAKTGSLEAEVDPGVDLLPYVAKQLPFTLTVDAFAPVFDWTVSISLELSAQSDGKIDL